MLIHRFGSFSGFRSHVSFMPKHQIGVVVLVNQGRLSSFLADMVACYVYDRLLDKPGLDEKLEKFRMQAARGRERIAQDKARREARPQTLPHPIEAYAGIYENDEFERMEWSIVDRKLKVNGLQIMHPNFGVSRFQGFAPCHQSRHCAFSRRPRLNVFISNTWVVHTLISFLTKEQVDFVICKRTCFCVNLGLRQSRLM